MMINYHSKFFWSGLKNTWSISELKHWMEIWYCVCIRPIQKNRGNNRLGKTRNLAKELRDTKGIFHANMGTITDRTGMSLAEAANVRKCWQEYKRRTVSKKGLNHLLLLLLLLLSRFSHVRLFPTPWTAPNQAPLSMGFSRHEYWSGVPLPSPLNHLDNHNGVITHIEQTTWGVNSSGS